MASKLAARAKRRLFGQPEVGLDADEIKERVLLGRPAADAKYRSWPEGAAGPVPGRQKAPRSSAGKDSEPVTQSYGPSLTPDQREQLATLERSGQLSDCDVGSLATLRMYASPAEVQRIDRLTAAAPPLAGKQA